MGQMSISRLILAVGALFCGVRALGYWVILQVGGLRPADRGGVAPVMYGSVFVFVILSSASAYLCERKSGARAIAVKTLYLLGAHGLPAIALFAIASRGAVFEMREVIVLLILFVCLVLIFRRPGPRKKLNTAVMSE
jgi:hypothetical protein